VAYKAFARAFALNIQLFQLSPLRSQDGGQFRLAPAVVSARYAALR
jgi:hypothetical protein